MKALTPSRPHILIVIGIPGAGKSFFARQFGETFNAPIISYDRIRFELFSEPTYSTQEQQLVERFAELQLHELIKTRATIIIDGGNNTKVARHNLAAFAKTVDYDVLPVWVQTDLSSARQRSLKRSSRRNDDKYNISLTPERFESESKRFTAPSANEHAVVISGKHTYNAQVKPVLKRFADNARADDQPTNSAPTDLRRGSRNIIIR